MLGKDLGCVNLLGLGVNCDEWMGSALNLDCVCWVGGGGGGEIVERENGV